MRRRPLVLIVDDSADVRELYTLILERDYEVACAPDGKQGLDQVTALGPDLIVLDGIMPGIDGLGFLEQLGHRGPPVVMTSGFDGMEGPALAAGAYAFLRKPVGFADFVGTVSAALRREPIDASVSHAINRKQRQLGAARRRAVIDAIPLGNAQLAFDLGALTDWLVRYFGFGIAWVNLQRDEFVHIQAISGASLATGSEIPARETFCSQVIAGGSPLVLHDSSKHPGFVDYPEACKADPFYAGVPLRCPSGHVLGTLCLTDDRPHAFSPEELALLEFFARRIAAHLEALAEKRRTELTLLETRRLVHRETLAEILRLAVARTTPDVAAVVTRSAHLDTLAFIVEQATGNPRSAAAAFAPDTMVFVHETPGAVETACSALTRAFPNVGVATGALHDPAVDPRLRRLVTSARASMAEQEAPQPPAVTAHHGARHG